MPLVEQLYLGLVVVAFISFAILIAVLSWLDVKASKTRQTETRPAARPASGKLGVSNA